MPPLRRGKSNGLRNEAEEEVRGRRKEKEGGNAFIFIFMGSRMMHRTRVYVYFEMHKSNGVD